LVDLTNESGKQGIHPGELDTFDVVDDVSLVSFRPLVRVVVSQ
jgi:hypothetical protein